jgi:hypothetical protein
MKVTYTLFSTGKEDTDLITKYGPMVPTPTNYGSIEINGSIETCERIKILLETKFRLT